MFKLEIKVLSLEEFKLTSKSPNWTPKSSSLKIRGHNWTLRTSRWMSRGPIRTSRDSNWTLTGPVIKGFKLNNLFRGGQLSFFECVIVLKRGER